MNVTTTLDFTKIDEIGFEGKNSKVFTAHDKQLDGIIVVKEILKTSFIHSDHYFEEAKRLYFSEHPNVVQVKYACQDSDNIYLAMPYYRKGSLRSLMESRFLTVREIVRYATQFLSGLNNIHVKKLIHFDVKPDNILLTNANEAIISDFGLTKNMDIHGLSIIDHGYTKHFPPEYYKQSMQSMLADIYMAGLTLYRMCNGNKIFDDQYAQYTTDPDFVAAIEKGKFPDRDAYKVHIPKKLKRIINQAISPEQNHRQQTVLELLNDLGVIDEMLDWQYSEDSAEKNWEKTEIDKKIRINLKNLAISRWELVTHKTILSSNNTSRISAGCLTVNSKKELDNKLSELLKSL
jgi:serine/threonine protein kinase